MIGSDHCQTNMEVREHCLSSRHYQLELSQKISVNHLHVSNNCFLYIHQSISFTNCCDDADVFAGLSKMRWFEASFYQRHQTLGGGEKQFFPHQTCSS